MFPCRLSIVILLVLTKDCFAWYRIQSVKKPARYLDVIGHHEAKFRSYDEDRGTQKWDINDKGGGYVALVNRGGCLHDAWCGGTEPGYVRYCGDSGYIGDNDGSCISNSGRKCWTSDCKKANRLSSDSEYLVDNELNIALDKRRHHSYQKWKFIQIGGGKKYKIQNKRNDKFIYIENANYWAKQIGDQDDDRIPVYILDSDGNQVHPPHTDHSDTYPFGYEQINKLNEKDPKEHFYYEMIIKKNDLWAALAFVGISLTALIMFFCYCYKRGFKNKGYHKIVVESESETETDNKNENEI